MKKLNQYFFNADQVGVSEYIFFYGLAVLVITILLFTLKGLATL